jgi:hypothetical protein
MTPAIQIRFTREDKKDDVITVEKVNYDWYYITYKDKLSSKVYTFQSTFDDFLDYLELTFNFVKYDQIDPYEGVQFSIPNYPLVFCTMKRLRNQKFLNTLWKVLQTVHNEWPEHESSSDVEMD